MTPVSHGKPCAGNPHARFDEGASASEEPRRNALLHKKLKPNLKLSWSGLVQEVCSPRRQRPIQNVLSFW